MLSDRSAKIGLSVFVAGATVSLSLLALYPAEAPSVIISVVSSSTASFAGAYVSYAVIARHLVGTERDRIDSPGSVCKRYDDRLPLLEVDALRSAVADLRSPNAAEPLDPDERGYAALPCVLVELDVDDSLSASIEIQSRTYEFPPSVDSLLEPRMDDLREQFGAEGKFNARKARLEGIEGDTIRVSETSYFRSFCTNFAPDRRGPNGGPTLRESFDGEFVRGDGLVSLGDSPFSDHLGGGGLAITTDGRARLGVRAADVTVGEKKVGHAFGGNFEYRNLAAGANFSDELRREAREEITGLDSESIYETAGLGLVRRVDWLGKPDVHSVALIDGSETYRQSESEFYDDLTVELPLGDVENLDELFEPETAKKCVRRIHERVEETPLSPSVNYYVSLELWLRRAGVDH
ncbi:hypothetical protein EXE43_17675 [Halorubrum sp. SS5]|nr:hypothetical protein EXE43_17675 [Halorubrum sp. SS5]